MAETRRNPRQSSSPPTPGRGWPPTGDNMVDAKDRTGVRKAEPHSRGAHEPLEGTEKGCGHVIRDGGARSSGNREESVTDSSCMCEAGTGEQEFTRQSRGGDLQPALRGRVAGSGKDGCRRPGWSLTEPVLPSQTPWGVTGTLGQHGDRPDLRPSTTATDRLARALPRPRGRQGTTAPTPFCKATAMVVIAVPPGPALCL